jgi:hypothetical protein
MPIFYGLHRSDKPDKKWFVEVSEEGGRKKRIYFGAAGMKDFTLFSPMEREARRRLYIQRHKEHENWNDWSSAGFWSKHLLWGDTPNINKNLTATLAKYNLKKSSLPPS